MLSGTLVVNEGTDPESVVKVWVTVMLEEMVIWVEEVVVASRAQGLDVELEVEQASVGRKTTASAGPSWSKVS